MIFYLRPAMLFAFFKAFPLICTGAYLCLLLAWYLSALFYPILALPWYAALHGTGCYTSVVYKYLVSAEYILIFTKGIIL
jgi:hypothetical protein